MRCSTGRTLGSLAAVILALGGVEAQSQSPVGVTLTANGTPYFSGASQHALDRELTSPATGPVVGVTYATGQSGVPARVTTIINENPPGTFVYTVPATTVPPTGSYTISPTAVNTFSNLSPPDTANLQSASDAARLAATVGGLLLSFAVVGALAIA